MVAKAGIVAAHILRRSPDRAFEEIADLVLQHPIGRQPDRVTHAFGFEELVDLRVGEGRIAAETAPPHSATVAGDHRLQHFSPAGGAVHVARAQGAPLQIAKLVEHEQRMITGAAEMPIIGAAFLCAVSRAFARIHIEHNDPRRTPLVHRVDPLARIGKSGEVFPPRQPFGLEAAHLAGRGSPIHGRLAADHPAHRRIAAQPIGVVHILVTSQPAEYRLPQQPDQQVASVPAGARLCQSLAAACGQCEHVVQLAIRQQSAVGGDRRAVEPEHHSPVEIEPQRAAVRFTHRVRHGCPVRSHSTYCSLYNNQTDCTAKYGTIRGMRA